MIHSGEHCDCKIDQVGTGRRHNIRAIRTICANVSTREVFSIASCAPMMEAGIVDDAVLSKGIDHVGKEVGCDKLRRA